MPPKHCQFCKESIGGAGLYRHVGSEHRDEAQECGWSICDDCPAMFPNAKSLKLHKGHSHSRKDPNEQIPTENGSDQSLALVPSTNLNNNVKTRMSISAESSPKTGRARRQITMSLPTEVAEVVALTQEPPTKDAGKGRHRRKSGLHVSLVEENDHQAEENGARGPDNSVGNEDLENFSPQFILDEERRLAERQQIEEKYDLVHNSKEAMKEDPEGFYFPAAAKYMCEVCNKIVTSAKSYVSHIEIHRAIIDEEVLDIMKNRLSSSGRVHRKRKSIEAGDESMITPNKNRRSGGRGMKKSIPATGNVKEEKLANESFKKQAADQLVKLDRTQIDDQDLPTGDAELDEIDANMRKMFAEVEESKSTVTEKYASIDITPNQELNIAATQIVATANDTYYARCVESMVNSVLGNQDCDDVDVDVESVVCHEEGSPSDKNCEVAESKQIVEQVSTVAACQENGHVQEEESVAVGEEASCPTENVTNGGNENKKENSDSGPSDDVHAEKMAIEDEDIVDISATVDDTSNPDASGANIPPTDDRQTDKFEGPVTGETYPTGVDINAENDSEVENFKSLKINNEEAGGSSEESQPSGDVIAQSQPSGDVIAFPVETSETIPESRAAEVGVKKSGRPKRNSELRNLAIAMKSLGRLEEENIFGPQEPVKGRLQSAKKNAVQVKDIKLPVSIQAAGKKKGRKPKVVPPIQQDESSVDQFNDGPEPAGGDRDSLLKRRERRSVRKV